MRRLLLVPILFLLTGGPAFASCNNTNYRVMAKIKMPPGTSGTKFLLIEPGASDVDIRNVASGSCGNRWCRLLMWDDINEMGFVSLSQEGKKKHKLRTTSIIQVVAEKY